MLTTHKAELTFFLKTQTMLSEIEYVRILLLNG